MTKPQRTKLLTKEAGDAQRGWYVVDLDGQVLGRAATTIAKVLLGKHKPTYTPHVDSGDFVVVVNADKVKLTGAKLEKKEYIRHSLFPGGVKRVSAAALRDTYPDRMVRAAVWGMLPKGRLGRRLIKKLKIYRGATHDHAAQKPAPLALQ
jgi:large subunit ribosomal protein L13